MRKLDLFISTTFYSGLIPGPGGTYGSVIGWGIMLFLYYANNPEMQIQWCIAAILITFLLGWIAIPGAIEELREIGVNDKKAPSGDFNSINIDEVHGIPLSSLPVFILQPEYGFVWLTVSLLFFRIFDILKPLGIAIFEKKMSGKKNDLGWKALIIMLDDTIAGIYAGIATLGSIVGYQWLLINVINN